MTLKLISNDDLIKELLNRFDHAVFAGVRVKNPGNFNGVDEAKGDIQTIRRWFGNSYTCAGLCSSLTRTILNDYSDREEVLPEGDI